MLEFTLPPACSYQPILSWCVVQKERFMNTFCSWESSRVIVYSSQTGRDVYITCNSEVRFLCACLSEKALTGETSSNKRIEGRSFWIEALKLNVYGKTNFITLFSHEIQFFAAEMFYFIQWSTLKANGRLCLMANSFCHLRLIGYWFIYQIFSCCGLKPTMPFPPTII